MPNYRRNYVPGGTYFFTLTRFGRRRFLTSDLARIALRNAIDSMRSNRPFRIFAFCLLPDHLHTVWILPHRDSDYSTRWRRIKGEFTQTWLSHGGSEGRRSASRQSKKERAIWQRRFWEHTVRDEEELKRCIDYIHWNPRKHGLVQRVKDWKWSSFHRFVTAGEYPRDWGQAQPDWPDAEWGE